MPNELNQKSNSYFIIFGSLDKNNIFKTKYILEFNSDNEFNNVIHIANKIGGLDIYLNSIKFNNNIEQIFDEFKRPLGLVYNLSYINKPQSIILNSPSTHNIIDNALNIRKNKTIIQDFSTHPLIGLQSIGGLPNYMNAIIQCFCQTEKVINYFKYNEDVLNIINKYNNENKTCLTNTIKYIIENLWPTDNKYFNRKFCHENNSNKYYAPYELMKTLNKNFDGPKSLINCIIMTLNEELNKKINKETLFINNNLTDQSDQNAMLNYFLQNFMKDNLSFISDNFYGTIQTRIDCLNCNSKKYNYEIFSYLIFPLEEVVKYKANRLMMNMNQISNNNIDSININECFEFYQRNQILSGENAIPCNKCNLFYSSNYFSFIFIAPEILILIFEKNKGSKIKLNFNTDLNLYNNIIERQTGFNYNLIGVLSKFGEFGVNECFIAFCKSPIDNMWYKYNNDFVSKVINFNFDIMNSGEPLILFYQKVK